MAFAEKAASDSAPRMGRPPLNPEDRTVTTLVRLEAGVVARIEAVAGKKQRAAFIREAVERELHRREK